MRTVSAATTVSAREAVPVVPTPAGLPPRAVSVPVLLLSDGKEVRVGDNFDSVASSLGPQAGLGGQWVEPVAGGERVIRDYDYAGTRFVLVFEPVERGAELRVAAIYVH